MDANLRASTIKKCYSGFDHKGRSFYKCNRPNVLQGLLDNQDDGDLD